MKAFSWCTLVFVLDGLAQTSVFAEQRVQLHAEQQGLPDFFGGRPPRTAADAKRDLAIDVSGVWGISGRETIIWQECLEVTITGNEGQPLHHHIANAEYITYDDTQVSKTEPGTFAYKAMIAEPTDMEKSFGATATLVFFTEENISAVQPNGSVKVYSEGEGAIRFIGSDGMLYFQQNVTDSEKPPPLPKLRDVRCSNTDLESEYCKNKKYDTDRYQAFTPACCGYGYGGRTNEYFEAGASEKFKRYVASCAGERKPTPSTLFGARTPRRAVDSKPELPLDLSGVFANGATTVWQECLEVTITGSGGKPLHHHIANAEYITLDDTQVSTAEEGTFAYKAMIVEPNEQEYDLGATAVLVFFTQEGMSATQPDGTVVTYPDAEVAIRFIGSDGLFYFEQNISNGQGLIYVPKTGEVPCSNTDLKMKDAYCMNKKYDMDKYNAFTPACCGCGYGGSIEEYFDAGASEVFKSYVASCSPGDVVNDDGVPAHSLLMTLTIVFLVGTWEH